MAYFRVLRPHQWLKNLLVFLSMLAGQQWDSATALLTVSAFAAFCLVASAVYVLNDLADLETDRAHPRKKHRPFASGDIPASLGKYLAAALLIPGAVIAYAISEAFLAVLVCYFILTCAYSLTLKRRMVIDICVLAGLYTVRIIAGGVAADITLSAWLLGFAVFFFLALAAVKRQAELIDSAARGKLKAGGRGYHIDDLPIISMIAIGAGYVSVLVMMLYVNSPDVTALYSLPEALWGVCAVLLYWITRMIMVAHRGNMHDDPIIYAVRDKISWLCFAIILALVLVGALA